MSNMSDEERPLDAEFFIKRDRDVSWVDEDFWEAGHVISNDGWPLWLDQGDLKDLVLEAGKARGLLRNLGGDQGDHDVLGAWPSLHSLLVTEYTSVEVIASRLAEHLEPMCHLALVQLRRVLTEDCAMDGHLDAVEGLLYMRGFDVMDQWTGWLFGQVKIFSLMARPVLIFCSCAKEDRGTTTTLSPVATEISWTKGKRFG